MINEDTICWKLSRAIELIEKAVKTGTLEVQKMGDYLHEARESAQSMENALVNRKELMIKHGIEDEYQSLKAKKNTPSGINKVRGTNDRIPIDEFGGYEFTVKDIKKDEVVYNAKIHAGVISAVEEINDIDADGAITGKAQTFMFGHDIAIWYGFDQLRMAFEAQRVRILTAFRTAAENSIFMNPRVKKQILEGTRLFKGGQNGNA